MTIRSENSPNYHTAQQVASANYEEHILAEAFTILQASLATGPVFDCPKTVRDFCRVWLAPKPAENFAALFLTNKHELLAQEVLFTGTINGASVHPREVVRACIKHNCAAVVFAHNHPSGNPEPSGADLAITSRLKDILAIIDVSVLDHIIVGPQSSYSLAEHGQV